MPDAQTSFTQDIPHSINKDVDKAKAVDAVFLFKVNGEDGGVWTVNMKDAPVSPRAMRATPNARLS